MARGDQLGRQWKIIQTLISSRQGKSAADLAEEMECHPRTVYRDLEALQVAGFHIHRKVGRKEPLVPFRYDQAPDPCPLHPHRTNGPLFRQGHAQSLQGYGLL